MNNALKLVSFNLRCLWTGDGINGFVHRAGRILDKIDTEMPDVICFQECTEKMRDFFLRHLPEYEFHYQGRNEDLNGEGLAFALRKDTIELITTDRFWLSPTPFVPGSRFEEQSTCPRICQIIMARMKKDNKVFRVYNNHLDHQSDKARILGITAVMERVKSDFLQFECPCFILGDFNAEPESEPIAYCNNYKEFPIVDLTKAVPRTFHQFGALLNSDEATRKIDYIYCNSATAEKPHEVTVWDDEIHGIYLSDHYPLCLEIEL